MRERTLTERIPDGRGRVNPSPTRKRVYVGDFTHRYKRVRRDGVGLEMRRSEYVHTRGRRPSPPGVE